MSIRFITRELHACLDDPVAAGLIAMPFVPTPGHSAPLAFRLSVVTGTAALVLTFLTDHHLGMVRVLPCKLHLAVDAMAGAVFVIAPFVLGFGGLDALYYRVIGATVLVVVGLHKGAAMQLGAA